MEFKAKRRKLKVTIEDVVYEVKFPTLGELNDYRKQLKLTAIDEQESLLASLLASLGLPQSAQDCLEPSDLKEIVDLLTDQKKT